MISTPDRSSTQLCPVHLLKPYFPHSLTLMSAVDLKSVTLAANIGVTSFALPLVEAGDGEELKSPQ